MDSSTTENSPPENATLQRIPKHIRKNKNYIFVCSFTSTLGNTEPGVDSHRQRAMKDALTCHWKSNQTFCFSFLYHIGKSVPLSMTLCFCLLASTGTKTKYSGSLTTPLWVGKTAESWRRSSVHYIDQYFWNYSVCVKFPELNLPETSTVKCLIIIISIISF